MKVFLLSIVGQTLVNLALLALLRKGTQPRSRARKIGYAWIAMEYLFFIVAYILARVDICGEKTLSLLLSTCNYYYIALIIYLSFVGMIYGVIYLTSLLLKGHPWGDKGVRRRGYGVTMAAMIPITVLLCVQGYYNTMRPQLIRQEVLLKGHTTSPDSLRILFVSDVHIGEIIGAKQLDRLVEIAQQEQPDYVLVGGDVLDYYPHYGYHPEIEERLRALHPDPNRIYHVLGNHEYYHKLDEKISWIKGLGTLLRDSIVELAPSVYLIGRDDHSNTKRKSLAELSQELPSSATRIVLDHQPTNMREEREQGIDLALHGHTHNGQFIPFKWVVAARFERSYGYYRQEGTQYYISSGWGIAVAPFRVGTHSEAVMLTLRFDKKQKTHLQ